MWPPKFFKILNRANSRKKAEQLFGGPWRKAVLEERANEAKKELHEDAKKKQQLLQQKKELMILKARLEKENLEKSFSRAESKLNKVLVERQAEVQLGCKPSKNLNFEKYRVSPTHFQNSVG